LTNKKIHDTPLYKDGFHVLIPEIWVTKGLKKYINNTLAPILNRIFASIDNIEPPEKMLDKMSASGPVFMFGNCKMESVPYKLEHVYEITMGEMSGHGRSVINVDEVLSGPSFSKVNLTYEMSLT